MVVEDEVGDVERSPLPGVAQDRLVAVVVEFLVVQGFALPVGGIAGESPGGLADVLLGVAVPPQGEQLHELAAVVLVGLDLLVGVAVEPDEHGRVGGDRLAQFPEVAPGVVAQKPVREALQARWRMRSNIVFAHHNAEISSTDAMMAMAARAPMFVAY